MNIGMQMKWTDGKPYEKSPRRGYSYTKNDDPQKQQQHLKQPSYQEEDLAQKVAMLEPDWTLQDSFTIQRSNKREDTYNKMSEREPICQLSQNPFMPNNSYSEVIQNQETFLKSMNTGFGEREKERNCEI